MQKIDEERYVWLLRVFGIFAAVSGLLSLVLLVSILYIAPSQKWDAFFVSFKDDAAKTFYVARAEDMEITQDSVAKDIAAQLVADYVINRESYNTNRDSDVWLMSSDSVRRGIPRVKRASDKDVFVSVEPSDVKYLNRLDSWEVEAIITTQNKNGSSQIQEKKHIEIKASFVGGGIVRTGENKWRNPLGFVVSEYRAVGIGE